MLIRVDTPSSVTAARGYVGTRTLPAMLGITPADFGWLEKIAAAPTETPVPAPLESVERLERAGLVFATYGYAAVTRARDWLTVNPTPAAHSVLHLVSRVHVGRDGHIDHERI
ncbi:MAG TPA: hypothetical protein PL072_05465 [Phycisphaerales bacterium]|nr:hypothetical protein [Phycisphaerales bacterium]